MCSCLVLCSLAEDEVKTESDVVEGMDASVRSKGKSLRPNSSQNIEGISEVIYSKFQEQCKAFCWSLRSVKTIHYAWLPV